MFFVGNQVFIYIKQSLVFALRLVCLIPENLQLFSDCKIVYVFGVAFHIFQNKNLAGAALCFIALIIEQNFEGVGLRNIQSGIFYKDGGRLETHHFQLAALVDGIAASACH